MHHIDEEAPVLLDHRAVETPALADARHLRLAGVIRNEQIGGVAGREPQQHEQDQRDEEQDRHGARQPQSDGPEHAAIPLPYTPRPLPTPRERPLTSSSSTA